MGWSLIPLLLGIVWMGLYPKPVLDRMEPAARRYIELSMPGRIQATVPAAVAVEPVGGGR